MNILKYETEVFSELDKLDLMDSSYIIEDDDKWWIIKINGKVYKSSSGKFVFRTKSAAATALKNSLFGRKLHWAVKDSLYKQKYNQNRFNSMYDKELEEESNIYVKKYISKLEENDTIEYIQLKYYL